MEILQMIYMLAVILISTVALYTTWKVRMKESCKAQLPRGNIGWPFFGETLEFISCARSPYPESFMDKRRVKYGDVFKSHIFGSPTIVSVDPEINKIILQSDENTFITSYPKSLVELMGKSSIIQMTGSSHKRLHGQIGSFYKSPFFKSRLIADVQNYLQDSMDRWEDNQLIHLQEFANKILFQVLVKGLISLEPGDDVAYLQQQFREFIAGLISIPVKIPGFRLHRSLQAKNRMKDILKDIIKMKRENLNTDSPRDVLELFMSNSSLMPTDDIISENIIDLMIPGEESMPTLVTLAVNYLSSCPDALELIELENMELKKRKEESGENISWTDYMSLSFTQNVISETLRMANIVNGVYRKAVKDLEIKGHLIPKGWCVLTYFRSIHVNKNIYADPHTFNPWRWKMKDTGGTTNFTPFGGGLRLCPGVDLARLVAATFLHQLVTNFRWVAEKDTIVSFPTVKMMNRMPIRVERKKRRAMTEAQSIT